MKCRLVLKCRTQTLNKSKIFIKLQATDFYKQGIDRHKENYSNESKNFQESIITSQPFSFSSESKQPNNSTLLPVFSLIESDFQEEEKDLRIWSHSRLPSSATAILLNNEEHLHSRSKLSNKNVENEESIKTVDSVGRRVPNLNISTSQPNITIRIPIEEQKEEGENIFN